MRSYAAIASLVICIVPVVSGAQTTETFLTTLGRDTLGVEQVVWGSNSVTGDYLNRQGGTARYHYVAVTDGSHRLQKIDVTAEYPNGAPAPNAIRSVAMTFTPDSVFSTTMRDTAIVRRFAGKGAYFTLAGSMGLPEIFLANMRAIGADSATIPLATTTAISPYPMSVKFNGDSAVIWQFGYGSRARVDRGGHILGFNGANTTIKVDVKRIPTVNLSAMESAFAAADKAGRGLGASTSPRDTVNAMVGTAHVWIDYSRPRTRGRSVFTRGVLGDTLWRTGANAATQLKTDADIVVGGKTIPAGIYTLWTHAAPDNSRYELIFNKQVGQWGTEYNPQQDLIRVPLVATHMNAPVDAFTIAVASAAGGSALQMQWGDTQLATPIGTK